MNQIDIKHSMLTQTRDLLDTLDRFAKVKEISSVEREFLKIYTDGFSLYELYLTEQLCFAFIAKLAQNEFSEKLISKMKDDENSTDLMYIFLKPVIDDIIIYDEPIDFTDENFLYSELDDALKIFRDI